MTENVMKYTYNKQIPLQLQIWLATNTYKGSDDPNAVSATAALKPVKSLILSGRAQDIIDDAVSNGDFSALQALNKPNLIDVLKSRMGTAIHDSTEMAWINNYRGAFKDLGYTDAFIDRIVINPDDSTNVPEDAVIVYTEKRLERSIAGKNISGELDFAFNGVIQDLKTTSTYAFKYADDQKHTMQMSIYKWIFEGNGIELEEIAQINYLFLDWSKPRAAQDPNYPQLPTVGVEVPLHDSKTVEEFLTNKIDMIEELKDAPEEDMPDCTPDEIWQRESKWAYYADPAKVGGRATRVFDNYGDAVAHKNSKTTGILVERPGEVVFCNYCAGASLCKQKDKYIQAGLLETIE